MRVIAGTWRGRRLVAPGGSSTRPTADRVREAVFSTLYSLAGEVDGKRVLDLYAGSGALGIEALSRGAAHATFVDPDRRALAALQQNLRVLGVPRSAARVLPMRAEALDATALGTGTVSLLFVDPPYRIDALRVRQVLERLDGVFAPDAVVVYEHAADVVPSWPETFRVVGDRRYGGTVVSFARHEG